MKLPLRWMGMALAAAVFVLLPLPAFSQNCALCYTQAASSGQKVIEALRNGILILVAPPTLASVGLIFIVHRKRNQTRRVEDRNEPARDW